MLASEIRLPRGEPGLGRTQPGTEKSNGWRPPPPPPDVVGTRPTTSMKAHERTGCRAGAGAGNGTRAACSSPIDLVGGRAPVTSRGQGRAAARPRWGWCSTVRRSLRPPSRLPRNDRTPNSLHRKRTARRGCAATVRAAGRTARARGYTEPIWSLTDSVAVAGELAQGLS